MSWQDREYNGSESREGGTQSALASFLSWSLPLGTWFGIRVRAHISLVLFVGFTVLLNPLNAGVPYLRGLQHAATGSAILFFSVLLHEFGHCFAARRVGGEANDIMMSPLGGLAMAQAPHRPLPQFLTVFFGPAVTFAICLTTAVALWAINNFQYIVPLNPLRRDLLGSLPAGVVSYYLWWVFIVNYGLLLFNLIPSYPLDGGQMLQSALWPKMGFYRSTRFAVIVGMVGAVLMGLVGLISGQWLLLFVAIFCFQTCYQRMAMLKQLGPDGFEETMEYAASFRPAEDDAAAPTRRRRLSRRAILKARRRAANEQAELARIDTILAKVSAHGMNSLTWLERRALRKATERQRALDTEFAQYESEA